jgi:uncharacterized protein YbjT (DUF2867 family)
LSSREFEAKRVLVTGATGYVGGRLVQELLSRGFTVRVLVRQADRVADRSWRESVEVVEGDLLLPETLAGGFEDVDIAYYLVHSMGGKGGFVERDRQAALNFVNAARGLSQVIYLGGLVPRTEGTCALSDHLTSRAEVGRILRDGLPTTEFRAGPIIGSGSASFEMVRYLTERLPIMVAPRWILNAVQTIAMRDILSYLLQAAGRDDVEGVIEVGAEPLTFKQMMEVYAEVRDLPRIIIPLPVLAPKLAALWVGLVTPIPSSLAVPLVEGIVHPLVGDSGRAQGLFPKIRPISYRKAVTLALERTEADDILTRWSGAAGDSPGFRFTDREGMMREVRTRKVDATPEAVFRSFASLGGKRGWRAWNWAWSVRGYIDRTLGGPGLRRGRRHPIDLLPGESVDCWRVEEIQPLLLLRLRAEMKVPGRAWLQFEAIPEGDRTRLVQTAYFAPNGFLGWLYWYGIYVVHALIFSGLISAIARDAEHGLP